MPSSGIFGSYGNFIPSFLRNLHTSSIVAVSIYIPTNSARGFPFLHILSSIYCLFVDFLMMAILTGVKLCLIVALICISVIMSNVEYLFMCLLAICMSSLERCPFICSAPFLIGLLFFWYWVVWVVYQFFLLCFGRALIWRQYDALST